jgi:DNA-binding FadR family transcriptional regulator
VSALQELLERMRTSDREHFADADVAFHAKIAELAGKVVLKDILAGIRSMIDGTDLMPRGKSDSVCCR